VTLKATAERVDQPAEREKGEPEQVGDIAQQIVDAARPAGMPVEAPGPEDTSAGPMLFDGVEDLWEASGPDAEFRPPTPVECLSELEAWAKLYGKSLKDYLTRTLASQKVTDPEDLTHEQLIDALERRREYIVAGLIKEGREAHADLVSRRYLLHMIDE
jgi:hypothetical protein